MRESGQSRPVLSISYKGTKRTIPAQDTNSSIVAKKSLVEAFFFKSKKGNTIKCNKQALPKLLKHRS